MTHGAMGRYFKTGQYLNVLPTVVFAEGYGSYMHLLLLPEGKRTAAAP